MSTRTLPRIIRLGALALLLAICGAARGDHRSVPPQEESEMERRNGRLNLALPTLGGLQFWADVEWRAGWRIQRHVWTGHHRLLDARDVRRAWGGLGACRSELDARMPSTAAAPPAERVVVLVHGLGRTRFSWWSMRAALRDEGFEVIDLAYPSTRAPIDEHAARLAGLLDKLEGKPEVSFVTHSLGGIVVRALFDRDDPWRERVVLGRIVMLAPPNQGARAAAFAARVPLLDVVLGPSLDELVPLRPATLPVPPVPVLVVRGERAGGRRGWNPWLAGADDGIVASSETTLPGATEQLVAPCVHTLLPSHRDAVEATIRYLVR